MMAVDDTGAGGIQRSFVQTAQSALPELDRWTQITEEEAALVADMTRRVIDDIPPVAMGSD